jgi:hypothetical protein
MRKKPLSEPMTLSVSQQVVNGGHGDLELAVDQAGQLGLRVGRVDGFDLDAVLGKKAFLLRHPDRPIKTAGENVDAQNLRRRAGCGGGWQPGATGHQAGGDCGQHELDDLHGFLLVIVRWL